jgi:hypothetical protein
MRVARYPIVALAALALSACGEESKPDRHALEQRLTRIVEKKTGTRDVTVDCRDGVEEGAVCDVTAPGGLRSKVDVGGRLVQP